MKSLLRLGSRLAVASGYAARCLQRRGSGTHPSLTVLAYHRIGDRSGAAESFPNQLDEKLISASAADFAWQIEFLRQHFVILSGQDVAAAAAGGPTLPPNGLLITFDDGYRDNFDLAFPILRRSRTPAVIFLTTSLIGGTQLPWWDEIALLLRTTTVKELALPSLGRLRLQAAGDRMAAREKLRRAFKALPADQHPALLADLRRQLGTPGQLTGRERVFLDWEEVNQMSRAGISFGAHTHTHPILTRLPQEQAEQEIRLSCEIIQAQTGSPPRLFAYPNGRAVDFNPATRAMLARGSFSAAFTLVPGSNRFDHSQADWLALRRYPVNGDDRAVFAARVSGALDRLNPAAWRQNRAVAIAGRMEQ